MERVLLEGNKFFLDLIGSEGDLEMWKFSDWFWVIFILGLLKNNKF